MKQDLSLFTALGEQTKYRILKTLSGGERCACEIPSLIDRTQSNSSMHLSKLTDWGLIKHRREGKKIIYSIKDKRVCEALKLLE